MCFVHTQINLQLSKNGQYQPSAARGFIPALQRHLRAAVVQQNSIQSSNYRPYLCWETELQPLKVLTSDNSGLDVCNCKEGEIGLLQSNKAQISRPLQVNFQI